MNSKNVHWVSNKPAADGLTKQAGMIDGLTYSKKSGKIDIVISIIDTRSKEKQIHCSRLLIRFYRF